MGSAHSQPLFRISATTATAPRVALRELGAGDQVGEYEIVRCLGIGGMGAVYEAIHPIIDKRVALKILRGDLCANHSVMDRFVREARAVNQIAHRNIVDVFGFGKLPDGRAYLAMELLTGESLATHIERYGALPVQDAVPILADISHALEAAHRCGIVHRDLKPDNVFLSHDRDGRRVVKLLDFGIAKLLGSRGGVDQTMPGTTMGTPEYMSPEQAQGRTIDCSADVYALGVLAFEMLTGRLPFVSTSAIALITHHVRTPPPVPSELARLPSVADHLLLAMLDKTPANRPSLERVRELLDQVVERVTGVHVVSARVPRTTGELVAVVHRRRWPLIAGAIAALALAIGAASWISAITAVEASAPVVELP
jgi:serine/threonine protein kinase